MDCLVKYCGKQTVNNEFCKGHAKAWQKHLKAWPATGETPLPRLDTWLAEQSDLLLDVCPTPYELALAICHRLQRDVLQWDPNKVNGPKILEPSAGDGVFVRAAREVWPNAEITAIEIRKECRPKLFEAGADKVIIGNLLSLDGGWPYAPDGSPDLVLGNPPFTVAEQHIKLLLGGMRNDAFLAFLLRVGFYGSRDRLPFWSTCPEAFFAPITPRPGFKLNKDGKPGTDSQEYGVFTWQAGFDGTPHRLPHIVWDNGKKRGGGRKKSTLLVDILAPDLE